MKFVKVTTENEISIIDIPKGDYKGIAKAIDARLFELVRINQNGVIKPSELREVVMIIDEEGLLKSENKCNPIASILYGTLQHGYPIVGDVMFALEDTKNPERDFADMSDIYAEMVASNLRAIVCALSQSGLSELLRLKYDNSEPPPPVVMSFDEYMDMIGGEA